MSELTSKDYSSFLTEIKARIRRGQYQALRDANKELLDLYWDIGESIHRKQEGLGWGKSVVETLASDLQSEFPGRNGFSSQNLWLMRQFYVEYRGREQQERYQAYEFSDILPFHEFLPQNAITVTN